MKNKFFKNITIYHKETIYNALKLIDINKRRFLICINTHNQVIGVLTDGDIRRALLDGRNIEETIEPFINKSFLFLTNKSTFDEVCEKFKIDKIEFLPIIDDNKKLINCIHKKQFHIMLLKNIEFSIDFDFIDFDNEQIEHEIYNKPWGFYKSIILTPFAQAKIITVFVGEQLSLQEHKRREEHWVIIKGRGKVVLGESIMNIYPGKHLFIPKGCKHQIINDGNENLIFAEVQLGEYFGEDDIIRYEDKYGRI